MENTIQQTGNVAINKINITSRGRTFDIKSFVLQTVIYEDLFSNVMTGTLVVRDAANVITNLKLRGIEKIEVSFQTPGFSQKIEKVFYVNSIGERILGEKEQIYVIGLISIEGANDNSLRFSQKYSGTGDEIVKKLYDEIKTDKPLFAQSMSSSVTLVAPFWSPLKIINWVANRSYNPTPNVIFFESNKKFYFVSIDSLINAPIYGGYAYVPNTNLPESSPQSRYGKITEVSPISTFDTFKGQDYGYFSGTLVVHDIALKQYTEFFHNHAQYKERVGKLDKHITFPKILSIPANTFRAVKTKHYNMFTETPDPLYDSWVLKRNSLMMDVNLLKFVITVPGKTDIEVGRTIDVAIPKSVESGDITNQNYWDPYLSGKYLITSIRHQFTINNHEMSLEISKDSFKETVE